MTGETQEKPAALLVQMRTPARRWIDVGILCHLRERSWFQTFDSYWDTAPRPVLGQIFEERGSAWRPSQSVTLPTWFSHLLPEGRLRHAVASAARVNPDREFFLLARIGTDDLPGRYESVRERSRMAMMNTRSKNSRVLVGTKNWAICYPDGRQAVLSPAFDIVPTVLYLTDDDLGLKLNGTRSFHDVTTRSFDRLARRAGWTEQAARARVREAVERVAGAWTVLADHLPTDSLQRLVRRRDALPLLRGS